jgi:hypothetical protein
MTNAKILAVGTKVIPFQKTTSRYAGLETSANVRRMNEMGRKYLYVGQNDYDFHGERIYVLSDRANESSGDFFTYNDVVPYDIQGDGIALEGDTVVFVGKETDTDDNQTNIFDFGKTYKVRKAGCCGRGDGVLVEDMGAYVIIHDNYLIVERNNPRLEVLREELANLVAPAQPEPLTAVELLEILKEEDEVVKSVNFDAHTTYDTYRGLEDLQGVWLSELSVCVFLRESDWDVYDNAVETYLARKAELEKGIEEAEKAFMPAPVEPEPRKELTFAEAVAHVSNGGKVECLDEDGDRMDTYCCPTEFTAITRSEIEEGTWYAI